MKQAKMVPWSRSSMRLPLKVMMPSRSKERLLRLEGFSAIEAAAQHEARRREVASLEEPLLTCRQHRAVFGDEKTREAIVALAVVREEGNVGLAERRGGPGTGDGRD